MNSDVPAMLVLPNLTYVSLPASVLVCRVTLSWVGMSLDLYYISCKGKVWPKVLSQLPHYHFVGPCLFLRLALYLYVFRPHLAFLQSCVSNTVYLLQAHTSVIHSARARPQKFPLVLCPDPTRVGIESGDTWPISRGSSEELKAVLRWPHILERTKPKPHKNQ